MASKAKTATHRRGRGLILIGSNMDPHMYDLAIIKALAPITMQ